MSDREELIALRRLAELEARAGKQVDKFSNMDPTEGMSGTDKFLSGAGKAFVDLKRGAAQLLAKTGLGDDQEIQSDIDESKKLDAPLMKTGAGVAGNVVGNIAALAPTSFIPGANTLVGASLIGGLTGAMQPVATGESRTANTVGGTVLGLGGQLVGNTIGRVVKPVRSSLNEEEARLAQEALDQGIDLNAAQQTGSKTLKVINAVLDNLPFSAHGRAMERQAQQQAFNRAVLKKAGVDADLATPDVISAARQRLGGEFQSISKGKSVKLGDDLVNKLAEVDAAAAEVRGMLPTENIDRLINGALDLAAKGKIKGETAQIIRSELTKEAKAAAASGNNRLKDALTTVRNAVDDSIRGGLSQEERVAWDTARRQYANLKTIEKSMQQGSADTAAGNISGAKLWSATKQSNPNDFVKGSGDLNDLSRIGQAFIKPQVPDSGTAQRLLAQQLLTGGLGAGTGYAAGSDPQSAALGAAAFLGGPKLAQILLQSGPGKAYLSKGLADVGPETLALINALTRTGSLSALPSISSTQ